MKFNEGDLVRVRKLKNQYWAGTWRVSSVMDRPPLAYIREVDGTGKGYIEQKNLERIEATGSVLELNNNPLKQLELF